MTSGGKKGILDATGERTVTLVRLLIQGTPAHRSIVLGETPLTLQGPSAGSRFRFAVPDEALARLQRDPNAELRMRVVDAVKNGRQFPLLRLP